MHSHSGELYITIYPYSYTPAESGETVNIEKGDVFLLLEKSTEEWWLVSPLNGNSNELFVPANYIQALPYDHPAYASSAIEENQSEALSIDSALAGSCGSLSGESEASPLKLQPCDSGNISVDSGPVTHSGSLNNEHENECLYHEHTEQFSEVADSSNVFPKQEQEQETEENQNAVSSANAPNSIARLSAVFEKQPVPSPRYGIIRDTMPPQTETPTETEEPSPVHSAPKYSTIDRSSFRKSLDDLINTGPEPGSLSGYGNSSLMSSTFSMATAAAPSTDCLFWEDDSKLAIAQSTLTLNDDRRPHSFFDVIKEGTLLKKIEQDGIGGGSLARTFLSRSHRQGKYFVQLTERALLFFKNQELAHSYTSVAQSKPEHSFELFAAQIEWKRGKKNTFQLYNDFIPNTKVLLKSANPYDAARWFESIQNVIFKLRSGITQIENDLDSMSMASSPLAEKGGSMVPQGRKPLIGPSSSSSKMKSQDSSSSLGSTGSSLTVKNCLAQLLSRRPTMDALQKKGIIKSEGVFGCLLETRCRLEKKELPQFVTNAMKEVERRGLDIEGIYRVCGNMAEIQRLRFAVDTNPNYDLKQVNDIHVITGALKMYFRELPESLFPSHSYTQLSEILSNINHSLDVGVGTGGGAGAGADEPERLQQVERVRAVMEGFPAANRAVITHLFTHLNLVIGNQILNKMDCVNVAIVFGPNLMFPPIHVSMAASVPITNNIITFTLANLHSLFPSTSLNSNLLTTHSRLPLSPHSSPIGSSLPTPTNEHWSPAFDRR